jgi:5-methylcytosine-specific restriction enzyme subunit McrC
MMDRISAVLEEWEEIPVQSPDGAFFLDEYPEAQRTAEQLSQARVLDVRETRKGIFLKAFSHVGRVQLGPLQVTIRPKIRGMHLLKLLRYAYGLRELRSFSAASFDLEEETFQDILIAQLTAEVENLLSRGLHRRYRRTEDLLVSPKGRIDINRMGRGWSEAAAALPCVHYPRVMECLPNQVLLSGLELAARLTPSIPLRTHARRLAKRIGEEVSPVKLDRHTFNQLDREANRLVEAYQPAFRIIRILAEDQGISLEEGGKEPLPGFLFDMNRFFQALLSRLLRNHLAGFTVRDEFGISGMMRFVPGFNPQDHRLPRPRPDFAILEKSTVLKFLDAKYRDLWEKPLPREMLYQLSIYALSQEPGPRAEAVILYPTLDMAARETRIAISEPMGIHTRGVVVLRPVNLVRMESIVSGEDSIATERAAAEYARHLVFGEF